MGLLQRAIAINANTDTGSASGASVETLIADFSRKNPSFYCLVLQAGNGALEGVGQLVQDVSGMVSVHGAACAELPGGKCLALLPSALDGELFAHRLSNSTNSLIVYQTSVNSASLAFEMLSPYIGNEQ